MACLSRAIVLSLLHSSVGFGRLLYVGHSRRLSTCVMSSSASQDEPPRSSPPPRPEPRKSHCTTICAVPPPSAATAWEALTRARLELRDPGFYRWPPHANLLYPFLELNSMKKRRESFESELFDDDMLDALQRVAAKSCPFEVTISELGVFGNEHRGVLWAYPRSYALGEETPVEENGAAFCNPDEPMITLQSMLEHEFPTCTEQRKSRSFHPHITLSHYASVEDALAAKEQIEGWWRPIQYVSNEIFVLRRVGDEGQFEIAATISLGGAQSPDARVKVHDPPIRFPDMPDAEEEWVYEERMKLKARRNSSWRTRGRKRAGRRRRNGRQQRIPDTPEIIAEKRAARKAKRERLEREAAEAEDASSTPSDEI